MKDRVVSDLKKYREDVMNWPLELRELVLKEILLPK
jgi:hypothetical protein